MFIIVVCFFVFPLQGPKFINVSTLNCYRGGGKPTFFTLRISCVFSNQQVFLGRLQTVLFERGCRLRPIDSRSFPSSASENCGIQCPADGVLPDDVKTHCFERYLSTNQTIWLKWKRSLNWERKNERKDDNATVKTTDTVVGCIGVARTFMRKLVVDTLHWLWFKRLEPVWPHCVLCSQSQHLWL